MAKRNTALGSDAEQILEKAKERGVESNYFFKTTFARYQGQIRLVDNLQKAVDGWSDVDGMDMKLIRLYNSTIASANGTAATLVSIIKKLGSDEPQDSKLNDFISAFKDDDP